MTRLPCPHCQRVCTFDPSKLPSRPVAFNCPGCGGKVIVDPAQLGGGRPAAAAQPTTPAVQPGDEPASGDVADLELPPGATLPHGLILGEHPVLVATLRQVLEPYGCSLAMVADPAQVAVMADEEIPPLLVFATGTASRPPLELLRPLASLTSAARRRTFVVLVADNVTTLDGNQAFFYQVNLVLATRDVGRVAPILYSALQYQRRLLGPLLETLEEREGGVAQ